jgi:hypothetical protein
MLLLHRAILNAPVGLEVDHINGDGLDNRRSNLRLATREGNQRNRAARRDNTSGLKGVSLHVSTGKWQARIRTGGEQVYLGVFTTPEAAHEAYAEAAIRLHGKFARIT